MKAHEYLFSSGAHVVINYANSVLRHRVLSKFQKISAQEYPHDTASEGFILYLSVFLATLDRETDEHSKTIY